VKSSGMTVAQYAKSRGVAPRAIEEQIEKGNIRLRKGRIDPRQADNAYAPSRSMISGRDDPGQRSARSKIAVTRGTLAQEREQLQALGARYGRHDDALELAHSRADEVTSGLRALAKDDPLFARFVELVLDDLGDLRAQSTADVERC